MSSTPYSSSNKLRFNQLWIIVCVFIYSSCEEHDALKNFSYRIKDYIHASGTNPHFAQADSLKYEQNYPAALKVFSKIIAQTQLSQNEQIYALNNLAFINLKLGENSKAQEFLQQLTTKDVDFSSIQQADFLFNQGMLALHLIQPQKAEKHLIEALKKYSENYPNHHLRVAQAKTCLALYYYDFGHKQEDFEKAAKDAFLAFYPKALDENSALHPFSAEVHVLMAHRYRSVARDYQAGLNHCEVAETLIKNDAWQDVALLARCLGVKGLFLKKEQRFQTADSVLNVGLKRLLAVQPQSLFVQELYRFLLVNASGRKDSLFVARSNDATYPGSFAFYFAAINKHLVEYQQPEVYIKLDELKAYYYAPIHHADNDSCRAACLRLKKSIDPLLPAYRYYAEEVLNFLANVNLEEKNYTDALNYQLESFKIDISKKIADKINNWATARTPQYQKIRTNPFYFHHQAGSIYLRKYHETKKIEDIRAAVSQFVIADSLMNLGLNMGEDGVLAYYQELSDKAYQNALEAVYLLQQIEPRADDLYLNLAFRFIERQKSFILYREDLLEGSEETKQYLKLIKKEAKQFSLLKADTSQSAFLNRTLTAFRYQDFLSKLAQKAAWKFNQTISSIHEVQAGLRKNEFIIQYKAVNETYFLLLAVGKHQVLLEKIKDYKCIKSLVKDFQTDIDHSQKSTKKFQPYNSYKLYQELIAPIEKILPKKDAELIFIPDDFLGSLPFDALVSHMPKSEKDLNKSFLLNTHYVAYAPSWKVWNHNRSESLPNSKHRAAFFSYDQPKSRINLFECEKEWKAMKLFFGPRADYFKKERCTKKNFIQLAYRYKVLHFSLHGKSDAAKLKDNQLFFKIKGFEKTDMLNGIEISDLDLSGKLAVLSACETNTGKITSEGMYSLSRAFLQAGCACTISALWKVNEQATAAIMVQFYANLQHNSPWVALSKAKREMLKGNYSSPAYWAGLLATI